MSIFFQPGLRVPTPMRASETAADCTTEQYKYNTGVWDELSSNASVELRHNYPGTDFD